MWNLGGRVERSQDHDKDVKSLIELVVIETIRLGVIKRVIRLTSSQVLNFNFNSLAIINYKRIYLLTSHT